MLKLITLVVFAFSINTFASKARNRALNNSFHLNGVQSEFVSPYHLFSIKDFVSVESGNTNATNANNGAEGIFKTTLSETSRILISVGHKDEAVQAQRQFINSVATTSFSPQQNPIEVIYAQKTESMVWGVGAFYSTFKDKLADNNETSAGLRLGASHGDFKWKTNLGLTNKVQNTTNGTLEGKPYFNLALRFNQDFHRFGFDYTTWEVKRSDLTNTETDSHALLNMKLQYLQTFAKDGEDFFYGLALDSNTVKNKLTDKKLNRLALPVWIGFENQSNDWLTLRGSIKQTIWAQSKDENGYTNGATEGAFGLVDSDYDGEPNNTETALGASIKLNNVRLDGTLTALIGKTQTQSINSTNILSQVAVIYFF